MIDRDLILIKPAVAGFFYFCLQHPLCNTNIPLQHCIVS